MDTVDDPVLKQLRKLREGPGLTTDRLEQAGAVLSALGTSDPEEGRQRLLAAVAELGESDRAKALRLDLGIGFPDLIGRPAVDRELRWLGDRRSAYASAIGRDVKTLSRWSDRAVAELRGQLIADTFTGHLYVVAAVNGNRIVGTTLIEQPLDDAQDGTTKRISTDVENRSNEPSLPCLVYSYPRDWRPASLTLVVAFQSEPYPDQVWATVADNIMRLPFGEERYLLKIEGEGQTMCRFIGPRRDRLYCVWWSESKRPVV